MEQRLSHSPAQQRPLGYICDLEPSHLSLLGPRCRASGGRGDMAIQHVLGSPQVSYEEDARATAHTWRCLYQILVLQLSGCPCLGALCYLH